MVRAGIPSPRPIAIIPPVLVPEIRSKWSTIRFPVASSISARNAAGSAPLRPPPSILKIRFIFGQSSIVVSVALNRYGFHRQYPCCIGREPRITSVGTPGDGPPSGYARVGRRCGHENENFYQGVRKTPVSAQNE